jgi:2-methylisocitrate lyase-like PEP mutase family enzyme
MSTRQKLRSLMAGEPFMAAECYSALSARIVEEVGFPAAYMGGHGTSMMHFAIPDNGVFTPTEMIEQAGRVAEAISIPLIIDADQCGETVADVYRSIQRGSTLRTKSRRSTRSGTVPSCRSPTCRRGSGPRCRRAAIQTS